MFQAHIAREYTRAVDRAEAHAATARAAEADAEAETVATCVDCAHCFTYDECGKCPGCGSSWRCTP